MLNNIFFSPYICINKFTFTEICESTKNKKFL